MEDARSFSSPTGLLERPDRGDHIAVVYSNDDYLAESVRRFVESGLRAGDGIVALCTLPRWELIRYRLALGGVDVVAAAGSGQLMRMGVHSILLDWMGGGCSQAAFNEAVGALVDIQFGQHATVRVYSELADVLLEKNSRMIAANMQRGWNHYLRDKPVSLLSVWPLDRLDGEGYRTRVESLYFTHKYVLSDNGRRP